MTDLGRLLNGERTKPGKNKTPLRAVAGKVFTQQALSSYERGNALPARESLRDLANCYGIPFDIVEAAYLSSVPQAIGGPIADEPFLNAVESIRSGDHLVIATQRTLLPERPELTAYVADLLWRGAHLTFVAYCPDSQSTLGHHSWDTPWQSNHTLTAGLVMKTLRRSKEHESDPATQVRYLLIGTPDDIDFAFLRAHGATVYLSRREESDYQLSQTWSEARAEHGKHFWHPCDIGFSTEFHDWLVHNCGMALPGQDIDPENAARYSERQLRVLSLPDFLGHAAQNR